MKIKKLVLVLLTGVLIFAGCVNKNLKLVETDLSASDFYQSTCFAWLDGANVDMRSVQSPNCKKWFDYMTQLMSDGEMFAYTLVSVMDYCMYPQNNTVNNEKVFVYDGGDVNLYVVVKYKSSNASIDTRLYVGHTYEEAVAGNSESYTFKVSENKTDGHYTFKETKNNFEGNFKYLPENGTMQFAYTFKTYDQNLNVLNLKFNSSFYLYNGNVSACRILVESSELKYVYEHVTKQFYQKMKIAVVKNESDYVNLENCSEEDIAIDSSGDEFGFKAVCNLENEANPTAKMEIIGIPAEFEE